MMGLGKDTRVGVSVLDCQEEVRLSWQRLLASMFSSMLSVGSGAGFRAE